MEKLLRRYRCLCWAIRDTWRGYTADDIVSLRKRLALAQWGAPGQYEWLSPEETRALGAGRALGIAKVTVYRVERGRALITVKRTIPDAMPPLRA